MTHNACATPSEASSNNNPDSSFEARADLCDAGVEDAHLLKAQALGVHFDQRVDRLDLGVERVEAEICRQNSRQNGENTHWHLKNAWGSRGRELESRPDTEPPAIL